MRHLLLLVLMVFLATPVFAAKAEKSEAQPSGGFEGPVVGSEADTVAQALKLPANSRILLKGNLVNRLSPEKNIYTFKDSTGEIEVHITPKQFKGQTVRPETPIEIIGKVIRSDDPEDSPRIRVRNLEIQQ